MDRLGRLLSAIARELRQRLGLEPPPEPAPVVIPVDRRPPPRRD